MLRVEVPLTINRIIAFFYRLRVWDRNEGISIWATALKLFQIINYVLFVISNITSAATTTNIQETVLLTDFSVLTGTHAVRMVYIVWKKVEILQFIDKIGTHCTDDTDEFVRVRNKINGFLKIAEIFVVACSGEAFLIMIFPIFTSKTLLNIVFPWEKTGITFWISHLFVSLGSAYCIIWFLITVIIWYLMTCCSCQYELLGNRLRNLGKGDIKVKELKYCSRMQQQQLFAGDLINAIKSHREIHDTIEHFSSTFSIFFFIQIVTSSIAICAAVYNLAFSSHENLLEDIFNGFFLIYNCFDIFVLMYLGNEIKLSSDRLSYCLFESNWIEQSLTCKRHIIIMTEVLKEPQEMIIGKLYPLNLRTFSSIVNGAYSMFNVLRK